MSALPHASSEDPVRLALLCQTVAMLFNKNGDEKNYTEFKNFGIWGYPRRGAQYIQIITYFIFLLASPEYIVMTFH